MYTVSPSFVATGPYGAIDAWCGPVRAGAEPPYCVYAAGALIHSASESNSETSTVAPRPWLARASSAVRIPEYAYMPAAMSATEIPTFAGASSLPVRDSRPASLWTSRSYALRVAYGPVVPYPDTVQTMRRG